MKKLLLLCSLAVFGLVAPSALAQEKLDMNKATCGEVDFTNENELIALISWIDGYLSAKSGDMVIDLKTIEENMAHIGQICSADKQFKLKDFLK